jgi:4,5-epoxidase
VQRLIWEAASQLKVTYRRGPLGDRLPRPFAGGLRPGDRVPDRECLRPDGRSTRLYAELRGRWALVGSAGDDADGCATTARKHLGEEAVTVLTAPDARDVRLVRPDGHLAWRGARRPEALDGWLTGMLDR